MSSNQKLNLSDINFTYIKNYIYNSLGPRGAQLLFSMCLLGAVFYIYYHY